MADRLDVFVCRARCGTLEQDRRDALSFAYVAGYEGTPLSLSMPVGSMRYSDGAVRPFLMGLLPDEARTRAAVAAAWGVSGDNPFKMLEHMGLDCPGGVQVCAPGTDPSILECDAVPLSDAQVAERLAAVRVDGASAWTGVPAQAGRWSLGGCQSKMSLLQRDGRWYECVGSQASTHILKPGAAGLPGQALAEYLTMRTARGIGLPVADVSYREFRGEAAVVVARYDRDVRPDGTVRRVHQEDLCQALGVPPSRKYADQGGPSTPDVLAFLAAATGRNARENCHRFVLYLFFNYLVGATDGHAKNHSLLLSGAGDAEMAPMYDVASYAPYGDLRPAKRRPIRAALSIGGENRFGEVRRTHIEKLVKTGGLDALDIGADVLTTQLAHMATAVPVALDSVVEAARRDGMPGLDDVAVPMVARIRDTCRRSLESLETTAT